MWLSPLFWIVRCWFLDTCLAHVPTDVLPNLHNQLLRLLMVLPTRQQHLSNERLQNGRRRNLWATDEAPRVKKFGKRGVYNRIGPLMCRCCGRHVDHDQEDTIPARITPLDLILLRPSAQSPHWIAEAWWWLEGMEGH